MLFYRSTHHKTAELFLERPPWTRSTSKEALYVIWCGVNSLGDSDVNTLGDSDVNTLGDSGVNTLGDSDVNTLGDSDVNTFGDSDVNRLGDSGVHRRASTLGGSAIVNPAG